jgi:hypothetical protein
MTNMGRVNGVWYISNSSVQAFKQCRRNWWLRWYRGLVPQVSMPLEKRDSGTRVHLALQGWYVPEGIPRVDPREGIELAIMADQQVVHDHLVATGWEQPPHEHPHYAKLIKANDTERIMIAGYMDWLEETGADAYITVIAPEMQLTAHLPELERDDIVITGKLDVRVRRVSDGARMVVDHKTRDIMPKLPELQRDEQPLHYELLEELTSDTETDYCDGAMFNVIRRVRRTPTAKPPFYARHFIPHNTRARASFRRRLVSVIRDMISVEAALEAGADHRDVVYQTPSRDCDWKCSFASVCTMFDDGSYVEDLLKDQYRPENPLHYYGDALQLPDRTGE